MRASGTYAPVVVSLKPAGEVGRRLEAAGVPVRSCGATRAADWRVFERLAAIIGAERPDVIHALLFHANQAARLAGVLSGFPADRILCEIQTVEVERPWHLRVERWTRRLSRLTIGNSPSVVEHLHATTRAPRARLRLVLGGVDAAGIAAASAADRGALGVGPNDALLLWVGRMDPVKGLDTLVAAFERLRRRRAAKLLVAGDGPQRPQVAADVMRRGLAGDVQLLGRRDDVPALLHAADLFVFPSRTEGFPNALLEAMAAGTPVVATDVPGCRDLVTDGQTGRLVPVDDVAALAAALDSGLAQRAHSAALARAAQERVAREFTAEACHRRYLALYAEVLDAERGGSVGTA